MAARARARYLLAAEDQTGPAFASVRANMDLVRKTARKLALQLGVVTGAAGLGRLVLQSVNAANEIGKLARQFDVSTEFLSEYRGVLSIVGVEFDQFTKGIQRQQKALQDANNGLTTAVDAFGVLGLRIDELSKLNPEQQFEAIGEALRRLGPGYRQVAAASDVLGARNTILLRLFNTQREEVAKLREEQIALGRSLSEEQVKAAEDVIDAYDRIKQAFTQLVDEIVLEVAPAVTALADTFRSILIPVLSFLRLTFERIVTLLGGIGRAVVALFEGQFSRAADIAAETFGELIDNVKETFELVTDPFGFTDAQQQARVKRGAERMQGVIESVFKQDGNFTLLDAEITKIQEFIGALRSFISARREATRGSSAQVDTSLQSLSSAVQSGDQRMLDQLKSIETLLRERKLLRVMEDIRQILDNSEGGAAVFSS